MREFHSPVIQSEKSGDGCGATAGERDHLRVEITDGPMNVVP